MVSPREHYDEIHSLLWGYRQAVEAGEADPLEVATINGILDLMAADRAVHEARANAAVAEAYKPRPARQPS